MGNTNSVTLEGKLVRDPEVKPCGQRQTKRAYFTLEIESTAKKRDSDEYKKDYIPCEAWGKVAEFCEKFAKGDEIRVEGRLEHQSWEDKDNPGKKLYRLKAVAMRVTPSDSSSEESEIAF